MQKTWIMVTCILETLKNTVVFLFIYFVTFIISDNVDWSGCYCDLRLLHVRNGNCKYHLGEETFKLAQSYTDKLAKHGHQANKAALYGELCALLFAKSHYDEVWMLETSGDGVWKSVIQFPCLPGVQVVYRGHEGNHSRATCQSSSWCSPAGLQGKIQTG